MSESLRGTLPAFRPQRDYHERVPPQLYFVVSAVFHYLGPAFAVLLFAQLAPLGVAWLRIASAAAIFALWRRPWRYLPRIAAREIWIVIGLGGVLAAMNCTFYLALQRLPLGTVGAIEFLGPIALALAGQRSLRNWGALGLAVAGVYLLTDVHIIDGATGYWFAFANCALFALYIVLGHHQANQHGVSGIDRLALSMLVAMLIALPLGFDSAAPALRSPVLLSAAIGVGICSSVIPYVTDQLAMARLPRASFAMMLSLLPALATVIGIVVLRQVPTQPETLGIALVIGGVAAHRTKVQ
jgi:inner membrane transporter RhtA